MNEIKNQNKRDKLILNIKKLQYVTLGILAFIFLSFNHRALTLNEYRFNLFFGIISIIIVIFALKKLIKGQINRESKFYERLTTVDEATLKKYFTLNLIMTVPVIILVFAISSFMKVHILSLATLVFLIGERWREKNEYIYIGKLRYPVNTVLIIIFVFVTIIINKFK